jgi:hypothetical protein
VKIALKRVTMKASIRVTLIVAAFTLMLAGQEAKGIFPRLKDPYLGQKPPGLTPEVFALGVVSSAAHEFACSFTPDGNEFYFTRRESRESPTLIMVTKCIDGAWTRPEAAPFNDTSARADAMSFEPMVTPDGRRLYFSSDRPLAAQVGAAGPPQLNIWYVERRGDRWGAPQSPGAPFNPMKTMYISMTREGTIYTMDISQGMGHDSIAVVKNTNGRYQAAERLGPPVNGGSPSMYPFISPDETFLIFASMRPGEKIDEVLLVSTRNADWSWREPRMIDLGLKAGTPCVSPDGKYLFFSGGERGKGDIYWVSVKIIEELRPKN